MIEFLTALLVIITGFYAWATFHILKANKCVVELMSEQSEALTRPYVSISAFLPSESIIFALRIANTGKTPAKNLKLTLDREFYKYGRSSGNNKFSDFVAFKEVIESFPPGAELIFDLAQGFKIFGEDSETGVTPACFSITAQYGYGDKSVIEENKIDLRPYFLSNLPKNPEVSQLKQIKESIEKTGEKIQKAIEKKVRSSDEPDYETESLLE